MLKYQLPRSARGVLWITPAGVHTTTSDPELESNKPRSLCEIDYSSVILRVTNVWPPSKDTIFFLAHAPLLREIEEGIFVFIITK